MPKNRIIEFADGRYYVFIDVYKEQHFHEIMVLVTVVLCFSHFIGNNSDLQQEDVEPYHYISI